VNKRVDLQALLACLAQEHEANEVLVEAGARLTGAFLQAGLLDELVVYMAPKLLGSDARPLLELPLVRMAEAVDLQIRDICAVGQDWRITCRLAQ
jgi:diaminohydroxyphosphoribosylaminopyrimidine deaminase/5-amino-6-(5-phosphoribosylamino)uracil reductase